MPRKCSNQKMNGSPFKPKEVKRNEKGEIVSWDSKSADGLFLRVLVEQGIIDGLTAGQLQKDHTSTAKYANKTITGALKSARESFGKEVDASRMGGSSGQYCCSR